MSGSTSGTDGPTQYGGQMPSCLRSGVEKRVELSHIDINYTEALALRAVGNDQVLHIPHGLLLSVSQPAGLCLRERDQL